MQQGKEKTPAKAGAFSFGKKPELHCCDEVGYHHWCDFLQELSHSRCHPGIHGCGTECIDADTFASLAESVLGKGH
jgi:hypothetical protein